MERRKLTIDIIKKEFEQRGFELISREYINQKQQLEYICHKHPEEGVQKVTYTNFYMGRACKKCGREKLKNQLLKTQEEVQNKIWNINPHVQLIDSYDGTYENVLCYCTKHNQYFHKYLRTLFYSKSGCQECYAENIRERDGLTKDEFIYKVNQIYPRLIVEGEYINNHTEVQMYCPDHDCHFDVTPSSLYKRKTCCPDSHFSKENKIGEILNEWEYSYIRQKTFPTCVDVKKLPFDYYLPDYNLVIEYDGEQHYYPVRFANQSEESAYEKFLYTQKHDHIKNDYCYNNNVQIIRIPYWEYDDMEYYLFDAFVNNKLIEENIA